MYPLLFGDSNQIYFLGIIFLIPKLSQVQSVSLSLLAEDITVSDPEDKWICPLETPGTFSVESYYEKVRIISRENTVFKNIWNSWFPTRISFFIWKCQMMVLLVDRNLIKVNIPIVSWCSCYTHLKIEIINHLLLQSDLASTVWTYFNNIFNIRWPRFYNNASTLKVWFIAKRKGSVVHFCFTLTHLLILWEIWKDRYRRRFKDNYCIKPSQAQGIIRRVGY